MPFGGEAFQASKRFNDYTDAELLSPMPFGGEAFQAEGGVAGTAA